MMRLFIFILFLATSQISFSSNVVDVEGDWSIQLYSDGAGYLQTNMTFEVDSNEFVAFTKKNADRNIFGYWRSTLARLFTKNFKKGCFARIVKGKITSQGRILQLDGIFTSPMGNYYFNGKWVHGKLIATLKDGNKNIRGKIIGTKGLKETPIQDYPKVLENVFELTKEKIFNKKETQTKAWKKFEKRMTKVAKRAEDDIDILFGFFYFSRKLPFTHFGLLQETPEKFTEAFKEEVHTTKKPIQKIFYKEKEDNIAYLKIASFTVKPSKIDSIFDIIHRHEMKTLIVDLRDNPGGDVSGIALVSHLADTEYYGGIFLNNRWFDNHDKPATKEQYSLFPTFSGTSLDSFFEVIHHHPGVVLKVLPTQNPFMGKVFVLTNEYTASTCEPIVYGLKYYHRAAIVGQNTAGAMLSAEKFDVKDLWQLYIPTANYYTMDGKELDQVGVEPDIKLKEDVDALEYVIDGIKSGKL